MGKCAIRVRPDLESRELPSHAKIVDVTLNGADDYSAEDAHVLGVDTINAFLERVSLLTYSPCAIIQVISTCPLSVEVGEKFTLVTHDVMVKEEGRKFEPEDLEGMARVSESHVNEAIHHTSAALSSKASDERLLNLHIAAERIALAETSERVRNKCANCGHEWDGPPASRNALIKLLQERGVSAEICREAVKYRARIAHGEGERDLSFYETVTNLAGEVQSPVVSTILDRANVQAIRRYGVIVDFPISTHLA